MCMEAIICPVLVYGLFMHTTNSDAFHKVPGPFGPPSPWCRSTMEPNETARNCAVASCVYKVERSRERTRLQGPNSWDLMGYC